METSVYPRKQLRREGWYNLNGEWKFAFDDYRRIQHPSRVPAWNLRIQVPFCPESKKSGIEDHNFHPRCWYQREFELKKSTHRVILHFGAADYESRVWVNNEYVGHHIGGHTPFSFDITEALSDSGVQLISVCVDDDPLDLAKPRGKQDWQLEPHSIWYPRTTGIWQTVWLEEVPQVYIERLRLIPHFERWEIGLQAFLAGTLRSDLKLRVRFLLQGHLLVEDQYAVTHNQVQRRIVLTDPGIDDYRKELLWTPENPVLIDVELELIDGDQVIDKVKSYTALIRVAAQKGRFLLNNRPYYLRMVLNQGYWPESLMTPPESGSCRQDVELIKAAGFNAVRLHQKIEDPEFLYWADVLGLLVWEEMPSAYRFTHESVERLMMEWMEAIDRDIDHPCIAVWVPFNESWGVPDLPDSKEHRDCVQAMYHLTRTLDPTRLVNGNDGWESSATDILGIHDYDDRPERLLQKYQVESTLTDVLERRWPAGRRLTLEGFAHQGQPIMLTEFGGMACIEAKQMAAGTELVRVKDPLASEPMGGDGDLRQLADLEPSNQLAWGYSICKTPDELRLQFEKLLATVQRIDLFSGYCYTQFSDTFQEANGLFTADRKPKFSIEKMQAANLGDWQ